MVFCAIAPTSWSECVHIMLGSIILSCSLRFFAAVLTALTMFPLVTSIHALLCQTLQRRFSSVPVLLRMWYTLRARDSTANLLPVYSWCNVCPILLFFWLDFFVLLSPPQAVCSVSHAKKDICNYPGRPHLELWTVVSLFLLIIFYFVSPSKLLCCFSRGSRTL